MNGQTVAILESRLGAQLAELIEKRGGKPLCAPALAEIPDVAPQQIADLIHEWRSKPVRVSIFQTGVGTHALFKTADALGLTETLLVLLAASVVVVRGPKPTAALNSRKVRIDLKAEDPFTTAEILKLLDTLPLAGERVVVQRYGEKNVELERALQAKGATVIDIPLYRWSLPEDTKPLANLIDALARHEITSVVFTSASQVHNLFNYAQSIHKGDALAGNLNATLVASIGPVCTVALAQHGVTANLEAKPPKLGPLVNALDAALSGAA
jgi:uroporphyrinogen-III synthase